MALGGTVLGLAGAGFRVGVSIGYLVGWRTQKQPARRFNNAGLFFLFVLFLFFLFLFVLILILFFILHLVVFREIVENQLAVIAADIEPRIAAKPQSYYAGRRNIGNRFRRKFVGYFLNNSIMPHYQQTVYIVGHVLNDLGKFFPVGFVYL